MKKIYSLVNRLRVGLLITATLFCFIANAQTPTFTWAKGMGGPGFDISYSMKIDASGNVYTTGLFVGTSDFDPGVGTFNMTDASGGIFVSKLDASGNFVWAKQMGGTGSENGYSLYLDVTGNVYITGRFGGTADFDPGVGTFNLTSAGADDIFICKLDVSGNFVWAKRLGGTGTDYGNAITLDGSGNVLTTGYFQSTVDFD